MDYYPIKNKITTLVILFVLFPVTVSGQTGKQTCLTSGYTIVTINGVLTNEEGAIENRDKLKDKLPQAYNGEKLIIEYLLNPTHLGGVSDLFNSITQKAFENEVVADYDLIEVLKDASQKVKTQKLLLVAHSQGNFYANKLP